MLVRNLQGLEALAAVDTLVFDKTGTLTRDGLVLRALTPAEGQNTDDLLALAALLARQSMHPASRALAQAAEVVELPASAWLLDSIQEVAGSGLDVWVQARSNTALRRHLRLGSAAHCGVPELAPHEPGQSVMLAEESQVGWLPLAQFHLSEDLRPEAAQVIADLRRHGVSVQLLSGRPLGSGADGGCQAGDRDCAGRLPTAGQAGRPAGRTGGGAQGRHGWRRPE